MCGVFGLEMENYQGDLNDIVRASSAAGPMAAMGCASDTVLVPPPHPADASSNCSWTQQFGSGPLNFSSELDDNGFGDPFSTIRDPLLHRQLNVVGSSTTYFSTHNSTDHHLINSSSSVEGDNTSSTFSAGAGASNNNMVDQIFREDDMRSPCSIFSRIRISPTTTSTNLQVQPPVVSPCTGSPLMAAVSSPRGGGGGGGIKAAAVLPSDMIDNSGPLQISSPRNLGIKRRKSQAKKVVCIPAPAAANSRSTGEVVPSDLWAWRKYGQKPIKGSPYPRGYYRCSSSKGCSARKQVERSRTDPNMLVITYTSEHNHPWPTQRNALAGSTRSQPSKTTTASTSASASASKITAINLKEEIKEMSSSNDVVAATAPVKEEINEEKQVEVEVDIDEVEFGDRNQTYRPALPSVGAGSSESLQAQQQNEDFFADLDEIEADPLNLLFSQGFTTTTTTTTDQGHGKKTDNKAMDPFSLFDWSGDNNSGF